MPNKRARKRPPKKSEHVTTNERRPSRRDIEPEVPQAPAKEPIAEPAPIGGTRGPPVQIEPAPD